MNWLLRLIAVSFFAVSCAQAIAQSYPARPLRFLVGFAPGGGTDVMARVIAAKLTESLKQQVIVDNRPGANANIAAKIAADSPGDGYTVLFMSVAHIMSKPVYSNLGYDIERDLTPITVVSNVSNVLTVNPALPARTVKEFIALAKAKPGQLTYATSGVGSPEHFAGEMFKMMTKTDLIPVPYKGGGPIAIDLVAGHVMASFNTMPPIIPHIQSGRVRAIAVTMEKRAAVLPDVPTIAESGVPGYAMSTWYGAVMPAKTPREIVIRLNEEMLRALALPDVKERLAALGADIVGTSPDETAAFFKTEIAKYTKVAHAANIHAE
ncbi:MAG TPA: tripartite tricarboxylate transporter substrate binding protein [Burkholderiales bacterium]|jgi:tripartite-type tricarboxylate transporter receptor subunit TctC|nr:tripartite tricarboxylate transporter substrate binding protein [Burkholderiales bacterium]